MAVRKSVRERLEEHKNGTTSTGTTTTGSNAGSTLATKQSRTRESVSDRLTKHKLEKSIGFDTFESDFASTADTINSIYGGWQDADTMTNTKNSVSSMYERLNNYKTYVNNYSSDDLTDFNKSMDELLSGYQSVLDQWDGLAGTYSQFQSADAYSSAKKNYELSEKYKGLDYAGVQQKIKETDDDEWLSQYGVNVGYSNLNDYYAEQEAVAKKILSASGEEKKSLQEYWQQLQTATNQYELEHKSDAYAYLMENEDFDERSQYKSTQSTKTFLGMEYTEYGDEVYEYINNVNDARDYLIALYKEGNGPTELETHGYEYMTGTEKAMFNYLYDVDKEKAYEYLDDIAVSLSKRSYDNVTNTWNDWADSSAFASTALSLATPILNMAGGIGNAVATVEEAVTGKEYNPYSGLRMPSNAANDIRQYVGENISEATEGTEIFGQNIPSFLYQTGMSIADTAVGTKMFGKGFTAVMGTNAASQKAKELKEAGESEEIIIKGAVASGLTEALFEKFSIDNILKAKSAETIGAMLKETAKQMGIEASEEMFTEIGNTVSDTLIRQNTSDLAKAYESYIYQGYTEEEARKLVGRDVASNVLWAGVGGALSGGVMGGVSSGANLVGNASLGNTIRGNNNVSELGEITSGLNNDAYAKYLELIDSGKIKNGQLGGLYSKVAEETNKNYRTEKTDAEMHAIANRANELGESRNSGVIASAIQKKLDNQSLSSEERTALKSDTAQAIMQEIERGEISVKLSSSFRDAYDTRARVESVLTTPKSEETVRVQKRVAEMNTGDETLDNESGQKIEIEGMSTDKEGNTVLQTSEGVRLLTDVTLSEHTAEIVAMAEGMDETKADTFVSLYKEGMDVEEYKNSFELAFAYGQHGFGTENVLKNKGILTEEQAASVYEAGIYSATEAKQKQIDDVTAKHFSGVTPGTFDDSAVDYSKVNTQQKAAIRFTELLSKATGVNIEYFQSKPDENGNWTAENGSYDASTNTIRLDVNAGITESNAKDLIIPTLSHELTHWMKENAPAAYKKISGIAMDILSMDYRYSPDTLVAAEQHRHKRDYDRDVSEEYAQDELVARACEDMLANPEKMEKYLSQMDEKTVNTFSEKLRETFEKIKEWLADLLGAYKSNSEEAKIVRKYADKINELEEAWFDAFDNAIKANQVRKESPVVSEEKVAASDRVQYSDRGTTSLHIDGNGVVILDAAVYSKGMIEKDLEGVKELVEKGLIELSGEEVIIISDNRRVTFDRIGADEYVHSKDTTKAQLREKRAKFNAAFVLKAIVEHAEPSLKPWEANTEKKHNVTAKRGWLTYDVKFGIPSKDSITFFGGFLKVRMDANGKDYVYDIVKLKKIGDSATHVPGKNTSHGTGTGSNSAIIKQKEENVKRSDRNTESIYDAVGELKRLQKENEKLKKDVERLRQRNKLERSVTGGTVLNESQIASVASYLLKNADSDYSKEQLTEELKDIYKYLQSDDVTWDIFKLKATDAASRIVAEKRERTVPNDYAKEILSVLRTTKVSLSDAQKIEAAYTYGKDWHKMYFGRVLVANEGIPLETAWKEWAQRYPDIFSESMSEEDMITEVLNIYDAVQASFTAAEVYDRTETERRIAVEIYNQFWNITPVNTLADKYEKEIKRLRYEHRMEMQELKEKYKQQKEDAVEKTKEWYQSLIRNIRGKRSEEIRQIKLHSQERLEAYKKNEQRKALVKRITTNSMRLNQWLTENSAKKHIPEPIKKTVATFLNSIDFSSKQLLTSGIPTKKDVELADALVEVRKLAEEVEGTRLDTAEEIEGCFGQYLDLPKGFSEQLGELCDAVNKIVRSGNDDSHVLNNMTLEQLDSFDKVIVTLKHAISQMNEFLAGSRNGSISTHAQKSILEMDELGEPGQHGEFVRKFFQWDNALPYYAFKRFGEGGQALFREFQSGWKTMAFRVKSIKDFTENTYTAKEARKWLEELHEFRFYVKGKEKTVQISTAQLMSLYCLAKRSQAIDHLKGGGIRIGDIKIGGKTISQAFGVKLNEGIIEQMTDVLTERQKEVADQLQKFMSGTCADWGNEVSMRRFGYRAFTEENYFPIQSDKNNLSTNDATEQDNSLYRLLNMSFAKKLTPNAKNRLVLNDIFTVFAQHTSDMAKYNALALPVLDAFKWYNYTEQIDSEDGESFENSSVKESMERAYGKAAKNYFLQFMRDINGSQSAGVGDELAKSFMGKYKVAAVAGNVRVVVLQPLSYIRAMNVMDPKYLFGAAIFRKSKADMAMKYSGIALWKSMGFYDTNISRNVQSMIKHDESWKDKVVEYSLKGAELADRYTWGKLWGACEAEIRDKRPELKVGSEAFNQIVAERFDEVIYATQVVDSTLTRTHLMRSKSAWTQMLTSFMSEPMISYNMLLDCYMDWQADAKKGTVATALKKNGKKIGRAIATFAISAAVTAVAEGLIDAWRDDDEEKEPDEKILENIKKSFLDNINPLSTIPVVRDIFSVLNGYELSRMDEEFISSTIYAYQRLQKDISENEGLSYKTVYNILKAVSQISGLPAGNLTREVVDLWNNIMGNVYPSYKLK